MDLRPDLVEPVEGVFRGRPQRAFAERAPCLKDAADLHGHVLAISDEWHQACYGWRRGKLCAWAA